VRDGRQNLDRIIIYILTGISPNTWWTRSENHHARPIRTTKLRIFWSGESFDPVTQELYRHLPTMIHTQEAKEPKEKIKTSTTHCSYSGEPNQRRSWPTSRNLAGEIWTHTGTKIGGVTKSNPKRMPASFQLRPQTEFNSRALRTSGETQERTGAVGTKTRASGQERNRFWCGMQDPARARDKAKWKYSAASNEKQ
jgi:hypothetical protein